MIEGAPGLAVHLETAGHCRLEEGGFLDRSPPATGRQPGLPLELRFLVF